MPNRCSKPCQYPGCNALAAPDSKYCEMHKQYRVLRPCKQEGCKNLTYEKYCDECKKKRQAIYYKNYDRYTRTKEQKQRYNHLWRDVRSIYIRQHPYCESCFEQGKMVFAEMVHHKIPLAKGGKNELDNLQSLCFSCHSKIDHEKL